MPPLEVPKGIFETIRYVIASSLPSSRAGELRHVLDSNGATYLNDGLRDISLTTVITNSNRFEGWEEISQRKGVDVVTDKWVERSLILGKIQLPQYYSADPATIFSGIVACACELPSADLEVLSAGITALGGQWRGGLTKDVTHLFALNPASTKYSTAMHYREETGVKVILPHWFDDAVRLGMGGLSTKPYEWPDPEILKGIDGLTSGKDSVKGKGKALSRANVEHDDVKLNLYATAAIFTPSHGRSSPPSEADISLVLNTAPTARGVQASDIRPTNVWNGRKILLSRTLELYKGRREAVHIGIERAGGVVLRFSGDEDESEDLSEQEKGQGKELSSNERIRRQNEAQRAEECDVLVTRWRYGRAYVLACKAGKVIGTLAWLFHVQSTGILSNPQDQLLHYPVPKRLIDAFSNHVITVTNYTGEAREYIKKLIYAMGARFTPSMSGQNTVLIAAFIDGAKAAKAQSWSIPVVNHTWLEDCFIQWRNLTVALEKYIVFPPGVNFSALLGERGVGVGSNVSSGIDDLASTVFEEDELLDEPSGMEGTGGPVQQVMEVDMPQGTDGSAKEVANNLVDNETLSKPGSKPQQPTKNREKLIARAPAGMDVEFEPPSTALIANQVDWDIDFGEDHQDQSIEQDDEHEPSTKKGTAKPTSRAKFSRTKTIVKASNVADESEEEEEEEEEEAEEEITMKIERKNKSNIAKKHSDEEEEGEDTSVVISKKTAKHKGGKRKVNEVIDSDDTTNERTMPSKRKASKFPVPRSSDDGMNEESEGREVMGNTFSKVPSSSKANVTSPSVNTRSRTSTRKPREQVPKSGKISKAKPVSVRSESDKECDVRNRRNKSPISATVPKLQKKRPPTPSDHSESKEEPKVNGRRKIEDESFRKKGKRKAKEVEDSSPKQRESTSTITLSRGARKGEDGLLKMIKGDARTRVKRKTTVDRISVESEDGEESEVQERVGKKPGTKAGTATVTNDEERDTRFSKSKLQTMDKKRKAPSRPQRSKPLRVYSSDEVESEEAETVAAANGKPRTEDDGTSDELLHLSSTSRKTKAGSGNATVAAGVKSKGRTSNSSLESELKVSTTANKQQVTSTPKRTVSVLVPSLTISGGSKKNSGKVLDGNPGARTDKSESSIQPKLLFGKPKSKFQTPVTNSSDEAEVEENVSPRTRAAILKDASLKTLAGQSSMKDVIDTNKRGKDRKIRKTYESSSITVSRKPALPEPIEVDDDCVPGSTPGSTASLGLPRRSAATKATQKLHDTVMPDLVNFEAQLKKSKGKGRQSVSLNAFALDIEKNRDHDAGKRKITGRQENEEESEDEDEQPKKKRRISHENDREPPKPKSKGKQKAKDDVDASRSPDVVLLTTQVSLSDDVLKTLTKLGVRMTTRPSECTHLLAPHLVRTEKFLCALACAPFILSAKWATASAAAKKLLPEKNFTLKDEAGEKKYDTDLSQALRRAKSNKGKLLEGKMFYVTPRVAIDKKLLKNVVNALGGQVTSQAPSIRIIGANPEMRHVISCKEDISIWRPIAAQGYKVYNQELLLMGAMKQKMEWEQPKFIVEA